MEILELWKKLLSANFLIFLSLFLIFRILTVTPVFSDETIYINMAKALSSGLLPYKDFFYAHPPIQIFLLAPIAFLENFYLVKFFISIIGVACVFLTYLVAKKLFDKKAAIVALSAFLIFPGFLIFGNLGMGSFEALLFFLLSFYFLLDKKPFLSNIFLVLAIFTRYLVLFLLPLLLIYIFKYQRKNFIRFSLYFALINSIFFILLYSLFGNKFLDFTIFYHFKANIEIFQRFNLSEQYLVLGFFTIFINLICALYGYLKKDFKIFLFSSYPLIYDLSVLLIFKQVIYHYFTFILPLFFVAFGATFVRSKLFIVKFSLILILILSFVTNLQSLNFYFNSNENLVFKEIVDYTLQNTFPNDLIFGSAIPTNYVSFVTNRKIVNNYFDSDLKFLNFAGREKILNEVKNAKPKLIFADQFYVNSFKNEYEIVKEWNIPGYYHLILMKLKD